MKFFNRNISIIIAAPAIIIILFCYLFLGVNSNDATFYLTDIYGDRSVLNGVTISGYLQDWYHNQHFKIINGEVRNKFNYYNDQRDIISPKINYANGLAYEDKVYWYQYEYKIAKRAQRVTETKTKDAGTEDIKEVITTTAVDKVDLVATVRARYEDFNKKLPDDYIFIDTDIYLKSDSKEFIFENRRHERDNIVVSARANDTIPARDLNNRSNALAVVKDNLFFTIPVTKKYSGTGGIYKLEEFGVWFIEERRGKVSTITEINLDEHNIDVLGLESAGDNLLLILSVDNVLTFRMFDVNGKMIDETTVPEYDGSLYRYDSFVDDGVIHFSFGIDRENFIMDGPLVSVSFEDERLTIEHLILQLDLNNEIARCQLMDSVDGKLLIVANTTEKEVLNDYKYSYLAPKQLKLFVYEKVINGSALLYKGELVTDINEDYEKFRYSSEPVPDYYSNREFVDINIQLNREVASN